MAKVRKELKLKSLSIKDMDALYKEYEKEYSRLVSSKYTIYGKMNVHQKERERAFEATMESIFKGEHEYYLSRTQKLTRQQFETEIEIARQEKIYGKRLDRYVRNLVHIEVKYSDAQNKALMENINLKIKQAWLEGTGRKSSKGRPTANIDLYNGYSTASPVSQGIINIMNEMIGNGKIQSDYLLSLNDLLVLTDYFKALYDFLKDNVDMDDLYSSGGEDI